MKFYEDENENSIYCLVLFQSKYDLCMIFLMRIVYPIDLPTKFHKFTLYCVR